MGQKQLFIEQIEQGMELKELFLVKYIAEGHGRDGKGYLNVILSDKTGQVEARMWSNYELALMSIKPGDLAEVVGKGNRYQKKLQIIIKSLKKSSFKGPLEDFTAGTKKDVAKMREGLNSIIDSLDDYYIKHLLQIVLSDPLISDRLNTWFAGKSVHHAYQGGLLEHILSCASLAQSLSPHYGVNRNYVVAGAILHDLCKVHELSSGPVVDYTMEGKLVGHLVKGVELIERFSRKIPDFPCDLKLHLKHIVVSHHGETEYGSPKVPSTLEAALVHYIDYLDSKMAALKELKEGDKSSGDWSAFDRISGRSILKRDLPFYENRVAKNAELPREKKLSQNDLAQQLKDIKL